MFNVEHLTKVDFHEQNWPNGSRVDHKSKLNWTNANFGRKFWRWFPKGWKFENIKFWIENIIFIFSPIFSIYFYFPNILKVEILKKSLFIV